MALEQRKMTQKEKAAVMLLCLDDAAVQEVFSHMRDEEVRSISSIIQGISDIPLEDVQIAMQEFYTQLAKIDGESPACLSLDGARAAEKLLSKALPYERSSSLYGSTSDEPAIEDHGSVAGAVNALDAKTLYELVKNEHPQFIAIVLSFAKIKLAREVFALIETEKRSDIIARIAKLEELPEQVVNQIKEYLETRKRDISRDPRIQERKTFVGGIDKAIKVLKSIAPDESVRIIDGITAYDETLGWAIEKQMLTMEDIVRADAAGMRELLRSISTDDLKVALKDMPDTIQERFYQNMSKRAAMILKEDIEVLPPQKVEDVERAQKVIIGEVKRLIGEGKLKLSSIEED